MQVCRVRQAGMSYYVDERSRGKGSGHFSAVIDIFVANDVVFTKVAP